MTIKSKYLLVLGMLMMLMMLSMVGCSDGDVAANTALAKIKAYATDSTNNPAPDITD
jgi:hypothetical protein